MPSWFLLSFSLTASQHFYTFHRVSHIIFSNVWFTGAFSFILPSFACATPVCFLFIRYFLQPTSIFPHSFLSFASLGAIFTPIGTFWVTIHKALLCFPATIHVFFEEVSMSLSFQCLLESFTTYSICVHEYYSESAYKILHCYFSIHLLMLNIFFQQVLCFSLIRLCSTCVSAWTLSA